MKTEFYDKLKTPPESALKTIIGGRLKGMTDINPQWRYQAMTEVFGPIGFGWAYKVLSKSERVCGDEILVFVDIALKVKVDGVWSEEILGSGGSKMASAERNGLFISDECYKMATTDALSVALKMLGVGADIYAGRWDGSKYRDQPEQVEKGFVVAGQKAEKPVDSGLSFWSGKLMGAMNLKDLDDIGGKIGQDETLTRNQTDTLKKIYIEKKSQLTEVKK